LSLTLRKNHRLRTLENRVLGAILGPKRDEITEICIKLHSKELHNLTNVIRVIKSKRMRWAENVPRMGETRNA
jgi:hypothetical protein